MLARQHVPRVCGDYVLGDFFYNVLRSEVTRQEPPEVEVQAWYDAAIAPGVFLPEEMGDLDAQSLERHFLVGPPQPPGGGWPSHAEATMTATTFTPHFVPLPREQRIRFRFQGDPGRVEVEGDEEEPAKYRSAVCTLIYPSRRRPEFQSTVRWLCKRLTDPATEVPALL